MDRPSLRALAAGFGGLTAAAAGVVGVSYAGARGVPLSALHGDAVVGPDWADRHGLRGPTPPARWRASPPTPVRGSRPTASTPTCARCTNTRATSR
ncbi:hypothetical protein [Halosegnis marinus]|uniref:hypothetical protein n=1 Tax=Halosegnis marinus TaxID=3034023 RepID=UPI00361DEA8F